MNNEWLAADAKELCAALLQFASDRWRRRKKNKNRGHPAQRLSALWDPAPCWGERSHDSIHTPITAATFFATWTGAPPQLMYIPPHVSLASDSIYFFFPVCFSSSCSSTPPVHVDIVAEKTNYSVALFWGVFFSFSAHTLW